MARGGGGVARKFLINFELSDEILCNKMSLTTNFRCSEGSLGVKKGSIFPGIMDPPLRMASRGVSRKPIGRGGSNIGGFFGRFLSDPEWFERQKVV